jgi:hypothetical protein
MTDASGAALFDPSDPAIGDLTVSVRPRPLTARFLPLAAARTRSPPRALTRAHPARGAGQVEEMLERECERQITRIMQEAGRMQTRSLLPLRCADTPAPADALAPAPQPL